MKSNRYIIRVLTTIVFGAIALNVGFAQSTNNTNTSTNRTRVAARVISPEVSSERKITFRLPATNATSVKLGAGDIQGLSADATKMTKGTNEVWEMTV
ncbi:MAG: axe1-6A 5 [Verrucomicrobiales bacterium]|nr:axe1-6A 5 [Verrucomicrobiales bacterium]